VMNGGFASPGWPNNAHGCLSRTLTGTLPTSMQESAVLAMVPGNYVAFSNAMQTQLHNVAHVRVGGTMMAGWSPEAPEFFLHHNHIDKLWDDWQKKSAPHLNAYSFPLNTVMPVVYGATAGDFNHLKPTQVMYVRASPSVLGSGHLTLLSCNLIKISAAVFVDLAVLQTAMVKASPTVLRQIPQLAAPILTADQEKMMIDMVKRGGGTEKSIQDFTRMLAEGRSQLTKANDALKAAGSLREKFEGVDKALGFDVAEAVKVLKVPPARSPSTDGGTVKPLAGAPMSRGG